MKCSLFVLLPMTLGLISVTDAWLIPNPFKLFRPKAPMRPDPTSFKPDIHLINGTHGTEAYYCTHDQSWAYRIREGVKHLHKHEATCMIPASGTTRVSCSHNSAIYVLNDREETLRVECDEIAEIGEAILKQCEWTNPGYAPQVGGHYSNNKNWTVEVRYDPC